MPRPGWEPRPPDAEYYAERTEYVRQGDLFRDVPLGYPFPPEAAEHTAGRRRFLSGPFDPGFAMLLSPTCAMTAQGEEGKYAHAIRAVAPVRPLEMLVESGTIRAGAVDDLRAYDHLINYFYLPALPEIDLPESVALIYAPVTLHHDYLEGQRVAQLAVPAAIHLKRQLAAHVGGELFTHDDFTD